MLQAILALFVCLNWHSVLNTHAMTEDSISTKIEVLKKAFPGGQVKEGEKRGELIVAGGKDDVPESFYTDVITDAKSTRKIIRKCQVVRAQVWGDPRDAVVVLMLYSYDGVQMAECCHQVLKLLVFADHGSELVKMGSYDFEGSFYMGSQVSLEVRDLNGGGRKTILVYHTESLIRQNSGTKLAILGFKNDGQLHALWYDYTFFDNVGSGRVPDENYYESFERKLDVERTLREGGKTLYFEKKIKVDQGKTLKKPRVITEKIALSDKP